ncbi:MAG: hypothetical protein FJ128_02980 [Deltaproteobacteria bacterium]|nr:hypothetical protein [Deltaproteobacteria bacterium]
MEKAIRHLIEVLRQGLIKFYGDRLVHLTLFGSQAREEAGPESDLDVLVVLRGPVDPGREIERSGALVAALSLAHDVVIACVFMVETLRLSNGVKVDLGPDGTIYGIESLNAQSRLLSSRAWAVGPPVTHEKAGGAGVPARRLCLWRHRLPACARHRQDAGATKDFSRSFESRNRPGLGAKPPGGEYPSSSQAKEPFMKIARCLLIVAVAVGLAAVPALAQDLKTQIVGKWEGVKHKDVMEFSADGKMVVTDQTLKLEGAYKVLDADTIDIELKEKENVIKVKAKVTIAGDTLSFTPEGDKTEEYKRLK